MSIELYDKLYYEILRARDVFDKLHQHLAWSGGSRSLERALRNGPSTTNHLHKTDSFAPARQAKRRGDASSIDNTCLLLPAHCTVRSIATQLGDAVSLENVKIAPATLGTEEIMVVIAKGKSTLQLQLLDELEQRDVYVEGKCRHISIPYWL